MLYLRILSALVGVPLILLSVYMGGPWYSLLILIVVNLAIYEYGTLLKGRDYSVPLPLLFSGVTLFIALVYLQRVDLIYPLVMLTFIALFMITLFRMDRFSLAESALAFWGIIYIGGLGGYLLQLRMDSEGMLYTFLLLFGVWIHDSLAYFIGMKWGVRKFAPLISPKKSVEGSLAGLIGTTVIFFSVPILFPRFLPLNPGEAAVLAIGIAVFAQLGDLLESALKRQFSVKDSGTLIPGHGGILDRFDSLLLTAPFVYYFFTLISIL